MNTLFTIFAVLALIGSVLITLIVLLQNGKGGGLASNFTAGNQTFGVRQTTDILEKITWGLAIFILAVSVAASFTYKTAESGIEAKAKAAVNAEESVEATDFEVAGEEITDVETPSEEAAQ